jgi:hypothetical protein
MPGTIKHRKQSVNTDSKTKKYSRKYSRSRKTKTVLNRHVGGGDIIEAYYNNGIFNKITATTEETKDPIKISYKKIQSLPIIKLKQKGEYIISFYIKKHKATNTSTSIPTQRYYQQSHNTSYNSIGSLKIKRTGFIVHNTEIYDDNNVKYTDTMKNYATDTTKNAFTLKLEITENTKNSNPSKQTLYFHINPI